MFAAFLPEVLPGQHPLALTTRLDYGSLADATDGYSGSDVHGVCKETAMRAIRKVLTLLDDDSTTAAFSARDLVIEPIVTEDVCAVLRYIKPIETGQNVAKYREWQRQFEAS